MLALSKNPPASLDFLFVTGPKFSGFIGVTAHLTLDGQEPPPLKGGIFQINYEETLEAAEARFIPWLDRAITEGLMQWRRSL
jgi:hypothetical protein